MGLTLEPNGLQRECADLGRISFKLMLFQGDAIEMMKEKRDINGILFVELGFLFYGLVG